MYHESKENTKARSTHKPTCFLPWPCTTSSNLQPSTAKSPQNSQRTSPNTLHIVRGTEPPLIAYQKGRNLTQMLTHKRLPSPLTTDTTPSTDQSPQHTSHSHIPIPSDTTCTICGRSFQTNWNLKIHFTHIHKKHITMATYLSQILAL